MALPVVAIVGRPNVGKSTLFNRLLGKRQAIVWKERGTTRDRLKAHVRWREASFDLIDTGGLELTSRDSLGQQVRAQVQAAIEEADSLVFLCDATAGVLPLDREIAQLLRRTNKPICLAINKVDAEPHAQKALEFYELGCDEPLAISAIHGRRIGELLDRIIVLLPEARDAGPVAPSIAVAIVGRPNVGKSSFLNSLLHHERSIVSPQPGTTRDAIDTRLEWEGTSYLLIDTAGIKHKRKVTSPIDIFGMVRSREAIAKSHVSLVLLDATGGLTNDDQRIIRLVLDVGKGLVVVVNKWDLIKGISQRTYEEGLRRKLANANFAPILFTSALTGRNVATSLRWAQRIFQATQRRIPTSQLNDVLQMLWQAHPPGWHRGRLIQFFYAVQLDGSPPSFRLFLSGPDGVSDSYRGYLIPRLRERFGLTGLPLRLELKARR